MAIGSKLLSPDLRTQALFGGGVFSAYVIYYKDGIIVILTFSSRLSPEPLGPISMRICNCQRPN